MKKMNTSIFGYSSPLFPYRPCLFVAESPKNSQVAICRGETVRIAWEHSKRAENTSIWHLFRFTFAWNDPIIIDLLQNKHFAWPRNVGVRTTTMISKHYYIYNKTNVHVDLYKLFRDQLRMTNNYIYKKKVLKTLELSNLGLYFVYFYLFIHHTSPYVCNCWSLL